MRLDLFLQENGFVCSRTVAKRLIIDGKVIVNGKIIDKPSFDVDESIQISISDKPAYVSRGAYKLEGAIKEFDVSVTDRICIDVGASSGGFTDYLLQNGAKSVIAVDSGRDQLAKSLRNDPRVFVYEGFNARYMVPSDFEFTPSLAVMDVSFISATYIIPALYNVLSERADFICLIKPQFEVGRAFIGKGGIVKDERARSDAVKKVVDFAESVGFICKGTVISSIKGGDGNIEYLAHFVK